MTYIKALVPKHRVSRRRVRVVNEANFWNNGMSNCLETTLLCDVLPYQVKLDDSSLGCLPNRISGGQNNFILHCHLHIRYV